MNWDINVVAGLVAGVAAMVPGSIIYSLSSPTGKAWVKATGLTPEQMKKGYSPAVAVGMMFGTSLINGLLASLLINSAGAKNVGQAVLIGLILAWFEITVVLSQHFFEQRSKVLVKIAVLDRILTLTVIGLVIGLFL